MRHVIEFVFRIAILGLLFLVWGWAWQAPLSNVMNLSIIVGGVLLTSSVAWTTTFVHYSLGLTFGVPIVKH